ncbi:MULTISPECIES: AarF/ABC1/UbiB kinase family protein [unclassified Synechocystis]|uniref:ABC1 kinase family protein n=1 Tax=unclassified Synechocystis TaxID=2640012 RepID=UPI000407DEF8|nr:MULTISPECIES: AarF/ABC1/UbiB kinase family protein [unclassified Synechocystis]AIE75097.1 Ubiquinone biosynthesis monooxygenase UbiB [Synechocystis sp. PCC 6714]MCT0253205.1 AarF/ABC1/UbiB kinase family protein [Synechocystis sp. CS-94]
MPPVPMPVATAEQDRDVVVIDAVVEEIRPPRLPKSHLEDLGPVSDMFPESWEYHPDLIMEFYRKRPLQVLGRLINILFPLLWFAVGIWWEKLWGKDPTVSRAKAIQLRELLTNLGPTYIKVGQALSTRPDLVPPTFLDELTSLQDQLPSFPNEVAYRFIEEELGAPANEIYAELSPEPIAAASLGQVYKGKLKTGESVAVKVQRPDLVKRITLDIYIMRSLSLWARRSVKRLRSDLVAITDELASRVFEEMNYFQEAINAEKFAQLYGALPEIYVPSIYWQYTGRRVLTMEWVQGTKLTNIKAIQAQGIDATHLVEVGVQCSLRQLLEHGFFHADPHPGNLLAMADGRLAYLDFGMMSTIQPYQRYGLIEAVVHLVNRDFDSLAKDYVKLDFLKPDTDLKPIIPALSQVFGNALGASVAELNFKSITDQMSAMMYEFPFRVPAYYALIIRSMVTLEGIAIGIDPNFKVLSKAYPYIAKRLLTDQSEELRTSLKELLFKDGSFRWNRLENLLRNAKNSPGFDFDYVLNEATDFLLSERGKFIRDRLVAELVNNIDQLGRNTWQQVSHNIQERIGFLSDIGGSNGKTPKPAVVKVDPQSAMAQQGETWQHLQNIWQILKDTPGFDPVKFVPVLNQIIVNPTSRQMGQQVAEGLLQKAIARVIRQWALALESQPNPAMKIRNAA